MDIYKVCKGPLCNSTDVLRTDFSPKSSICKKCLCYRTKQYYLKNDRPYRKYKNQLKREGSCVTCGCTDIRLLEFDHMGHKTMTISHSFSKSAIQKESTSTQFLCVWCHRLKSRKQLDLIKEKTNLQYTILDRPSEGKACKGLLCKGQLRNMADFYTPKNGMCKVCQSYGDRQQRESNYTFLQQLKLDIGECEQCKIEVTDDTTCCFDFDHLRDKTCMLSNFVRKNSDTTADILEESKKCRLLCCKCHRIVTASDFNYTYETNNTCVQ
jgi:hypothetical protein